MSDHFDGRRFFNPTLHDRRPFRHVLTWLATRKKQRWPNWVEDPVRPDPPGAVGPGELAATFVGQSTFLLQLDGVNVLTDPIWSRRASPVSWAGPRRVRRPGLAFDRLPQIHLVLVSHNHYDHMDLPTLRRLERRFRPLFLTGLGNARFLRCRGLGRVEEIDWWQAHRLGRLDILLTPALHYSRRGLFDRHRSLWGGFVLQSSTATVFFAGDSAYGEHFQEIGSRLGPIDLALLPIGAYEPRWLMQAAHMNPEEAVRAHLDLGTRHSIGMHFGTFQLTDEAIDEPAHRLRLCLAERGLTEQQFRVPGFGETVRLLGPVS
jgi:L-ascorbate metabolism protein UlaG (beta-lactamase superfamily)